MPRVIMTDTVEEDLRRKKKNILSYYNGIVLIVGGIGLLYVFFNSNPNEPSARYLWRNLGIIGITIGTLLIIIRRSFVKRYKRNYKYYI